MQFYSGPPVHFLSGVDKYDQGTKFANNIYVYGINKCVHLVLFPVTVRATTAQVAWTIG